MRSITIYSHRFSNPWSTAAETAAVHAMHTGHSNLHTMIMKVGRALFTELLQTSQPLTMPGSFTTEYSPLASWHRSDHTTSRHPLSLPSSSAGPSHILALVVLNPSPLPPRQSLSAWTLIQTCPCPPRRSRTLSKRPMMGEHISVISSPRSLY